MKQCSFKIGENDTHARLTVLPVGWEASTKVFCVPPAAPHSSTRTPIALPAHVPFFEVSITHVRFFQFHPQETTLVLIQSLQLQSAKLLLEGRWGSGLILQLRSDWSLRNLQAFASYNLGKTVYEWLLSKDSFLCIKCLRKTSVRNWWRTRAFLIKVCARGRDHPSWR